MHSLALLPHPDSPSLGATDIKVDVERRKRDGLALRFQITGEGVEHLKLPRGTNPARRDELWRATCFEMFLRLGDEEGYYEYNFSPARDWACYRFESYREGMAKPAVAEPEIGPWSHFPRRADKVRGVDTDIAGISRDFAAPFFELSAVVDLSRIIIQAPHAPWRIGLSAVIEDRQGAISYWALAHPVGAPDFHHPDCFALSLAAARPA